MQWHPLPWRVERLVGHRDIYYPSAGLYDIDQHQHYTAIINDDGSDNHHYPTNHSVDDYRSSVDYHSSVNHRPDD